MMNRDTSSAPERRDDPNEPLTEAIVGLKDELRVLRMVLDELRSDVQFITRNGLPSHEAVFSEVSGIQATTKAGDENEPQDSQAAIEELKDVVATLAQEQVNMLLAALDQVRDQLVAVIRRETSAKPREPLLSPLPPSSETATPPETVSAGHAGSLPTTGTPRRDSRPQLF